MSFSCRDRLASNNFNRCVLPCPARNMQREGTELTAKDLEGLGSMDWGARAAESSSTEGIRVLDALAATALRSIRYVKEIPGVREVVVNDLDEAAVQAAQRNVDFNQVDSCKIRVQQGDAIYAMHASKGTESPFDVIDLDPYGSAAPFLDAAVQSVAEGGLLCVTCTDMGVLSGGHPETCYAKYGSMPTKGKYLHEMALRILLHALEAQANRYRRHIVPVLSLSIDFYVRLFVRVFTSAAEVKRACTKASYVHQSLGCGSFFLQPVGKESKNSFNPSLTTGDGLCPQTGKRFKIGGPIWNPPIHDMEWVGQLLTRVESYRGPYPPSTRKRIHGMLTSVSEELPDVPLFYTLPDMCSTLHCNSPRMVDVQAAIINAGFRVSQQHKEPQALKTDAPDNVVWDVMRCWVKKHPVSDKRKSTSPGQAILARKPELEADFTVPSGLGQKKSATRYQQNPEPYWGPKARAVGNKRGQAAAGDHASILSSQFKKTKTDDAAADGAVGGKKAEDDSAAPSDSHM